MCYSENLVPAYHPCDQVKYRRPHRSRRTQTGIPHSEGIREICRQCAVLSCLAFENGGIPSHDLDLQYHRNKHFLRESLAQLAFCLIIIVPECTSVEDEW